jgi:copper homeostasis protein
MMNTQKIKHLELAAFDLSSALLAAKVGMDRIEFCADYILGGITPSIEDFMILRKSFSKAIYVMIRPRGGDFVYSQSEILEMEQSIAQFIKLGADGFVFGVLTTDNQVDIAINKQLVAQSNGLPVSFHRAFDRTANPFEAMELIIQCGFQNILSSGRQSCVLDGKNLLVDLQKQADNRITFIAGGGVRSGNLKTIMSEFYTSFYHSSGIVDSSKKANESELIQLMKIIKEC